MLIEYCPCLLQIALNEATSTTVTLKASKRLKGHTSSVQCVAASPSGSQVLDYEEKKYCLSLGMSLFAETVHLSDDRETPDYLPLNLVMPIVIRLVIFVIRYVRDHGIHPSSCGI